MFKIVVSTKEGKSYQIEKDVPTFIGMKIGQTFDGSLIGLNGYTLRITGGSDKEGFPMRKDMPGTQRKKILIIGGVGYRQKKKGVKRRKTIRGNRISEEVVQVNVKVEEQNKEAKKIEELLGIEKKEKPKKEEPQKEEKKEEEPIVDKEKYMQEIKESVKKKEKIKEIEKFKLVKILEHIPQFLGTDEKVYGPLEKDDLITLENKIADLLVSKNKAEFVEI